MKLVINKLKTFKHSFKLLVCSFFVVAFILFFISPIISLGHYSILLPLEDIKNWQFISQLLLPDLFSNTIILCIGTMILTSILGTLLAISIEFTSQKLQLYLELLLTLPIAFPIYVYSFAYVGTFEWTAPIPKLLRGITGLELNQLSMKNIIGAIIIFSLALYPYVFIPLRLSLKNSWQSLYKVGLLHNKSKIKVWWDIVNGLGRMPVLMGGTIVGMECLSEFGGVSIIGIDTFTTAIYTSWSSFFSLEMASRLGLILLLFSMPLIFLETYLNKNNRHTTNTESIDTKKPYVPLVFIMSVIFFSLLLPSFQLLLWLIDGLKYLSLMSAVKLVFFTLILSALVALLSVIIALSLISITRFKLTYFSSSFLKKALPFFMYGYGLPGNLIAIAILGIGQIIFPLYNGFNAILMLIAALVFKFQRTSYKKIEVGDQSIGRGMFEAGKIYSEEKTFKFFNVVYLPILKPFYLYGAFFVAIEVIKELPLVMILRPMGFNTLSTKIYELTSEGEWERATVYSFPLIIICLASHLFMYKRRYHEK